MINTPNALVGGGVANTDFDDFTNPTASDALNSSSVPHALQHSNSNDALERVERYVLARGVRVAQTSTTTRTGTGSGDQTLMSWTLPGIASTGWVTTNTLLHLYGAGTIDTTATGLLFDWKLKIGPVLASGVSLGTIQLNCGGAATAGTGTTPLYDFEIESWVGVADITDPANVLIRASTRLTTCITNASGPFSTNSHDHTVHLERKSGVAIKFNNTAAALIGFTSLLPGTVAGNGIRMTTGFVSLESI